MTLLVHGKGKKEREIPMTAFSFGMIYATGLLSGDPGAPMLGMSDRGARRAVSVAGERAGIARPVASHDLRMTFGTWIYYQSGKDLRLTQEILGHADSSTTEMYVKVDMDRMRKAMEGGSLGER